MNRRALVLAGLAALPSSVLAIPASARPRRTVRQQAAGHGRPGGAGSTARRRHQGGLTASGVRTRTITRTFASNAPITIPGGAPAVLGGPAFPYPSTIQVGGFNQGRIVKVVVTLNGLTHEDPDELDIMVVAPGNVGVILLSDAANNTDIAGGALVFDQGAPSVPLAPLTSGTYQPLNNGEVLDPFPAPAPQGVSGHFLTRFTNRNPNGRWQLFIVDDSEANDTGTLAGWALRITARVRVPHQHRRRNTRRAERRPVR